MESEQNFSLDAANNDDTDDRETRHYETGSIDGSGNETSGIQSGDIEPYSKSVSNSKVAEDGEKEIVVPDNYMKRIYIGRRWMKWRHSIQK